MPKIMLDLGDDGIVRWKPAGGGSGGGNRKYNWINGPACPQHGPWKVIAGGHSEKTGNDYDAFYVCTDDNCPNRPGRDWANSNPASANEVFEDDAPWPDDLT